MSVRKFFAMCKFFCVSIVWNENAPPRRSFAKTANQSSAETINIKFLGFCTQAIVFFAYAVFPHRSTGRASRIFLYYNRLGREYAAVNKQKPPFLVFFMKPVRLDVADHVRTVIGPISDKTAALLIKNRQNAAAFRKTPPIFLFNLS